MPQEYFRELLNLQKKLAGSQNSLTFLCKFCFNQSLETVTENLPKRQKTINFVKQWLSLQKNKKYVKSIAKISTEAWISPQNEEIFISRTTANAL